MLRKKFNNVYPNFKESATLAFDYRIIAFL